MSGRGLPGACAALLLSWGLMAMPSANAQGPSNEPAELAFAHDGAIFGLAADGSARDLIAARERSSYGEPAWSPDGSTLAFVRATTRPDDDWAQIMLMDAAGMRPLTPLRRDRYDASPAWSPDGQRLVFSRFKNAGNSITSSIVTIGRDGSGAQALIRRRLSRRLTSVGDPGWLPDGSGVSYTQQRIDRRGYFQPSVLVVNANGDGPRQLLRDAQSADWSPDGTRIAYSSVGDRNGEECGSDQCSYNGELYVARADGTEPRRLTRNGGDDAEPDWSPDGTRILFSSDRNYPAGLSSEVYSITADGRCLTWLTNGTPASLNPVWRPGPGRTEPGACGAAGRRPLIETGPSDAAPGALWLGPMSRGLLLSEYSRDADPFLAYDDCGGYRPTSCPRPIQVLNASVCARHSFAPALGTDLVRLRQVRGALLATYRDIDAGGFTLYTGRVEVTVSLEQISKRGLDAETRALIPRLRPISGNGQRSQRLPPPRVPRSLARKLRNALAGRVEGVSPTAQRRRLRLAKALQATGGVRTARCPRRQSDASRRSTGAPPAARAHIPAR